MTKKVQWGILGAATIAVEEVIPALLQSRHSELLAIASRNLKKAEEVASTFKVPKCYGSYEALLADQKIQAVYIPLPNHLHVHWAIKALQAGKHVLVEKPIALTAEQAIALQTVARNFPKLKVMEAFMYKFHPQWLSVKEMIQEGAIGKLKLIQASFSFFDDDAKSIVNNKEFGGGSLMDVGCYPVSIARFLFNTEPKRVTASLDYHPEYKVDIHASAILDFEEGRAIISSSIQLCEDQKVKLLGTEGSIDFDIPFNPEHDKPAKIWLIKENSRKEISMEVCNQYSLQVDLFSKAILTNSTVPVSLSDAVQNMVVIDAIKESSRLGKSIDL